MEIAFTEYIKAIIELGFPVAVSVYLLIRQGDQIERFRKTLSGVNIGLYLILQRLELLDEYRDKLKAMEAKRSDDE